jgi:TonB-dependent starch-binding outer membrane protein SusC
MIIPLLFINKFQYLNQIKPMKKSDFYKTTVVYLLLLMVPLVALPQYANSMNTNAKDGLSSASFLSLKEILKDMEGRYGVHFTYRNATVANKVGRLYNRSNGVDKALTQILSVEGLKYKKVDNIYVIYAPSEKQTIRELKKVAKHAENSNHVWVSSDLSKTPTTTTFEAIRNFMNPDELLLKGRVINEIGEGMPGVNIVLKGSSVGVTTDTNGDFSISAPENGILIISFIGYSTLEIPINNRTMLDVQLQPDLKMLNEIVVVGYGSVEKKDLVGAVGVANSKEFGNVVVSNARQLIQGKIAGVQVINEGGLPGSNSKIVIRGTGTFTDTEPVYVIDGIQGGANEFNSVAPYDIESITVLKDAGSIAIYGASASNGVVLVTTKRAKIGAPKITYNGYFGVAQPWNKLDMMNATQYLDLVKDITASQGSTLTPKLQSDYVKTDRTDWQDAIFRTANLSEHNIGITGGSEKISYNISGTYTSQDGIMENYNFKRGNLRFSLEENLGRFKFGQSFNFRYSGTSGNTASFTDALRMPTYAPIYDPTNLGGFSKVTSNEDLNDAYNPLTNVFLTTTKNRDLLSYAQFFGEVDVLKGLKFRSQASLSFGNYSGYSYNSANKNGNLTNPNGITEYYGYSYNPLLENYLTYSKVVGIHSFQAMIGNTYSNGGNGRSVNLAGSNFPNDDIKNIIVAPTSRISGGGAYQAARISYFGRLNYTLKDKYLFTATFRRDGSPNFPVNNRFANFPSAGLAWKIQEESFMQSISVISQLKLRASYGITGNDRIPLIVPSVWKGQANNVIYSFGSNKNYVQGSTINLAVDPNLKWETTKQLDIGLDLGLLDDRLNFTFDYYDRDNQDLIMYVAVPLSTGIGGPFDTPGNTLRNAASARNKGVEISATYASQISDFKYSLSLNGAYNKNEVNGLGTGTGFSSGGVNGGNQATFTDIGQPIGSFYGFKTNGIAASQTSVDQLNAMAAEKSGDPDAKYQNDFLPGDVIFQDLDNDGQVTDKDKTFLGSPIPKVNYGGNINLGWKSFDFMASFYGIAGVSLWNDLSYWTEGTSRPFNSSSDLVNRWKQSGDISEFPRAGQNANGAHNLRPSDRFVQNGAYMRLRNLTLGYSLPKSILVPTKAITSARFYVTAQNLITITKYEGYDPEIGAQDSNNSQSFLFARGIDGGQYPQPRSFLLGVQVGF